MVLRLLRIDRVDVAVSKIKQDKKESDARIDAVKGTLQDIDKLNSTIDQLKQQKVKDIEYVKTEKIAVKGAEESLVKIKRIKDALEKKHSRYQNLTNQMKVQDTKRRINEENLKNQEGELEKLEAAKSGLSEIKPKLKPFPSIKIKKEKLDTVREKWLAKKGFEKQLSDINQKINGLKKERKDIALDVRKAKNLDAKLAKVEKTVEVCRKKLSNLDKEIAGKRASTKEYSKQKAELSLQFERIKKLGPSSKCPICNKIIGKDFPDIVGHFKKEIGKVSKQIATQLGSIDKLSDERKKFAATLETAKEEREKINNLLKQRTKDEQKKDGLDRQLKAEMTQQKKILGEIRGIGTVRYDEHHHNEVKKLFNELVQLDKQRVALTEQVLRIPVVKKSIRSLRSSLASISKKMGEISNSITTLGFKDKEYEQTKKSYDATDKHYHNKREDLIKAKNRLDGTIKEIGNITKQITEEKKKRKQIEKEEKKIEILNSLEKIFGDFRIELISRIRPVLSLRSSELLRKLTEGKYPNIAFDEDYNMLIEDSGKQFPLERFSGGEEDLASLCLRIAISQVIEERSGATRINFIALDEIFGSQDETRRNNILKALNELSSQFRQIIVITHVEDIKDMLPYVFNVIEMADNSSKIITEGSPRMALSA